MSESQGEEITIKQLAMSNAYQLEALINVLAQKRLLTSDELYEWVHVLGKQRRGAN